MRKCSCCGNNGHNSRTCNEKGCVKLFGVNIKRSLSLGDLEGYVAKSKNGHVDQDGYVSDGDQSSRERKKGKPWTEEEHRNFLAGLMKRGKGDWRGISRNFVPTRTPTQVASHAQKYFMRRQASAERKKRRSSVFDMTLQEPDPAVSYFAQFSLPKISGVASSEASTSASVALKETVEPQQQNNAAAQITNRFPSLSLDSTPTPTNPAMQSGLPYYITNPYMGSVPGWTAECIRPCQPYMPYDSGRIGKLSPLDTVHPNSFSKPPFPRRFPNQEAPSKRANSLELELKIGQAIPQSPRAANMSPKEASAPIGVLS